MLCYLISTVNQICTSKLLQCPPKKHKTLAHIYYILRRINPLFPSSMVRFFCSWKYTSRLCYILSESRQLDIYFTKLRPTCRTEITQVGVFQPYSSVERPHREGGDEGELTPNWESR